MPAITAASRRAKRVIESATPSESSTRGDDDDVEVEEDEDEGEGEGEEEGEEEEEELEEEEGDEDGAGEEDELESEGDGMDISSAPPSDGEDYLESGAVTPSDAPANNLKIKLRLGAGATSSPASGRGQRAAAKKAIKKTKRTAKEAELGSDEDEMFDDEDTGSRATSPSKMTARQRARQNKDLQETLIALPDSLAKIKPILTEAERLQKREEMARRRKRQNEQRLQDEQDQTINRLLRAQTGRSRSKLDHTPLPEGDTGTAGLVSGRASGVSSPVRRGQPTFDGVRYVSKLEGENVVLSVAVRAGHEEWLDLGSRAPSEVKPPAVCGVKGCGQLRKYRCVASFEEGGCSVAHLKEVEARVRAA